jgi:hypothetical protein
VSLHVVDGLELGDDATLLEHELVAGADVNTSAVVGLAAQHGPGDHSTRLSADLHHPLPEEEVVDATHLVGEVVTERVDRCHGHHLVARVERDAGRVPVVAGVELANEHLVAVPAIQRDADALGISLEEDRLQPAGGLNLVVSGIDARVGHGPTVALDSQIASFICGSCRGPQATTVLGG